MPRESRVVYPVRAQKRRPFPRRLLFVPLVLLLLASLGVGLWYALRLPALRVGSVVVYGAHRIGADDIEPAVRAAVSGTRWVVFPADSLFVVSAEAVERRLRDAFPEIQEVDVDKRLPNRLIVRVAERRLWGVYCAAGGGPRACAYLDGRGTAYEVLARYEGWLLPVIYGSDPAALGTSAVPPETLAFYGQAEDALHGLGTRLLSLSVSSSTPGDARLATAEGWTLIVTSSRPAGEWLGALEALLADIGPRRANLDYVDLRFGAKVFYKFK